MITLEEVFGVSKSPIRSYVEHPEVDGAFERALRTDRHIVVYGASKQGKTSLVSKYLSYDDNIVVHCGAKSSVVEINKRILKELGAEIVEERQDTHRRGTKINAFAKIKAKIPALVSGEMGAGIAKDESAEHQVKYKEMDVDLEQAQNIYDFYKESKSNKFIIMENFHYLSEDAQRQLAIDLRTYQDLGMRYIILGIWKEKNKLNVFNGDLTSRVDEISVEPWDEVEFVNIIKNGSRDLNIEFSDEITKRLIKRSKW